MVKAWELVDVKLGEGRVKREWVKYGLSDPARVHEPLKRGDPDASTQGVGTVLNHHYPRDMNDFQMAAKA
jgi:hypothetical protein